MIPWPVPCQAARVALAGFSLTTENVSDTTFDGTLTGGPQSQLIKQGVGKLTLTGASDDFAGAVTLNAGTLQLTNASALGDGLDSVAVQSAGTLEISGVTLNRDIRLDDGATLRGTGAAISQGVVTVANGGNIFLATDSVADSLTFGDSNHADRLTGGAGSTLTVSGAGKVVLTAGNDLAANVNWTVMNGGTIDISSDQQLSSAISPSGILELQGGTLEVTASTILASGRQIKLAGASGTIEISGAGTAVSYSGIISQSDPQLGLTKAGAGELILAGRMLTPVKQWCKAEPCKSRAGSRAL